MLKFLIKDETRVEKREEPFDVRRRRVRSGYSVVATEKTELKGEIDSTSTRFAGTRQEETPTVKRR